MKKIYIFLFLITNFSFAQNLQDTKGELQISSSGTATYKVPVALPPAIKDVAPQLALVYNGSSVQGIAGMGWNLIGISSISRVSSRIDLDGILDGVDFDNLDRFALDGQRLIEKNGVYGVSGTTYQTENYSNLKIESTGNFWHKATEQCRNYSLGGYPQTDCTSLASVTNSAPQSFTVTFVDGSKAYYGGTEDSRGLMNWMINRWIDPQGNYIDYIYETENNAQRIKKISWGSNINISSGYENKIEFNYIARLRTEYSYLNFNNIKIEVNKILSEVVVSTGGEEFRKYTLLLETVSGNYQRVKSITESNGTNENANPIVFNYENTTDGFAPIVKYNGVTDNDLVNVKLSGDFDGNGEQDFITSNKLYLNPIDNNSTWIGIPFSLGIKYFTAQTLTNNKLNQFQSIVKVEESASSISFSTFNLNPSVAPHAPGFSLSSVKSINFNNLGTYTGCDDYLDPYIKDSNKYLEGDFNGDGISEVLIKSSIDETIETVTEHNYNEYQDYDECVRRGIYDNGYEYSIVNLDPNSPISDAIKLTIQTTADSQEFVIDFNGDGKSDVLIINQDKSYKVVGFKQLAFAPWIEVEILSMGQYLSNTGTYTGTDSFVEYNKDKQMVFGDFNGDNKTDIMLPEAVDSSNWLLYQSTGMGFERIAYPDFELYKPYWQGAPTTNRTRNKSYRAADLDKDGKSDFIIQEYETLCVNVGINGCDRNGRGHLTVRKNIGSLTAKPTFEAPITISVNSDYGYSTPIDVLIGSFKNHTSYNNFVFIQGKQVWKGNFNKDLSKEATMIKVTEANGTIVQDISYKKLLPSSGLGTANDLYYSSNAEKYPFAELASVPTMFVVDKLTATANNQSKTQQFRYFGLVTHSQGLGVIGFKKVVRSSWYNDQNIDKIWSISITSPQLSGAVLREFTSKFHNIPNPNIEGLNNTNPTDLTSNSSVTSSQTDNATIDDYLSRKDYYYTKVDKGSKVNVLRLIKNSTKDLVSGTYSDKSFEYDAFENVAKSISNNGIAITTLINTVLNTPTATDNTYCIGKLLQKNESVNAYGDTFTSEEKYNYDPTIPNQVKQSQSKGHNTDYVNTDYVYDGFGNVTKKTISAPGVSSRTITDTYDTNGRFVITKTDNEGYVTTFEYNKLGQQIKSKNYLNVESNSYYDNWGKLLTHTVTGASSAAQTQFYAYSRDASGYNVTTTSNTPGDFSRVFYDVFGREIKTTKRGFETNSYISKSVEYDFLGRKVKESEPYFDASPTLSTANFSKSNTITYDYLSRPITQLIYTGKQISITYNGLSATTADGTKTVTTTTDANGNKTEQTDNGETLKYTYYANGNLKETNYGNHKITMQYDGWGRQIYMQDPSVSATAYIKTYNNFSEILTDATPTGTTTIEYFPTGKLKKKTQTGQRTNQVSNYNYDSKGFLISEIGTINGKGFSYYPTYDGYYRTVTNTEITSDNLTHKKTFTYDSYGRILTENTNSYLSSNTSVNNGNNTIEYGYNSYNGLIDQYKDPTTILWKLNTANEKMQALTASLGNGMQITNKYDSFGYFETANHASTTATAINLEYQFEAKRGILNYRKNNIVGVLSWNESFTYDNYDRLTSWTDPTGTTGTSYETDGRIKNNDQVGTYNYETGNRYRKKSATLNATGLSFYTNRSLQEVTYDMFKNPISITEKNRGKVNFEYNLNNSRSKSSITSEAGVVIKTKYYSGIAAVEIIERPNNSLQFITYIAGSPYDASIALEKTYTNTGGNYTPSTQEYLYLHRDYQGTILAVSGNGGIIKERRQYDAWGLLKKHIKGNVETLPSAIAGVDFELLTDRGYTGHEHFFSVGIIHMNARLYDPILHTFLSADALIADNSNPQNYNRYAYALNNPLMYADYDGNEVVITTAMVVTAAIIGGVIAGVSYVGINLYNGTAITWGGLTKSILVGAVSGVASMGIGQIAQSATTAIFGTVKGTIQNGILLALTKGVMHGVAQGFIQGVSGGNAGQSFITAMATSVAGDAFGLLGNDVSHSVVGKALFGSVVGGITSNLQGGNFWEGATIGLTVSLLNHAGEKLFEPMVIRGEIERKHPGFYKALSKMQSFVRDNETVMKYFTTLSGFSEAKALSILSIKSLAKLVIVGGTDSRGQFFGDFSEPDWDPGHIHVAEYIATNLDNGGYNDKVFGTKVGIHGSSFFAAVVVLHELVHYGRYWNFMPYKYIQDGIRHEAGATFEAWSFGNIQNYEGATKNAVKYGW